MSALLAPRWDGTPGRLEVWYTTLTDPATGTGVWVHHELVAPTDRSPALAHGWAAVFPPGGPPVHGRFGPEPWTPPLPPQVFASGAVSLAPDRLQGQAGDLSWDLAVAGEGDPLFTFPRWSWRRELLPAAQVVPQPSVTFTGTVAYGGTQLELHQAPGATARIYGHGNALRWAWLHADLSLAGGEPGDVCEVVAAVSRRPGMRLLPPLPFVRLRVGGQEWPAGDPLLGALRLKARIGLPTWTVQGRLGDRRIQVEVTQRPEETLLLDYANPDGEKLVCRNSERADCVIHVDRRTGGVWARERSWHLEGTAHAEVGSDD
jgi:hypothetical protein